MLDPKWEETMHMCKRVCGQRREKGRIPLKKGVVGGEERVFVLEWRAAAVG